MNQKLKFDWDPKKNAKNIQKHKVDFAEAETVFLDEHALEIYDGKHSANEDRYSIIGMSSARRELIVCHCYRNGDSIIRIFSARIATKYEKKLYERGYL